MSEEMIIDAHQHFWNPLRGDYGWMPHDDPVLSRQYMPLDLQPHLANTGVLGSVLVQAAPSVAESEYLLGIADTTPHVLAVVGWVDFTNPSSDSLQRLSQHPAFVGVRPMIQDIPDADWMFREDVQWAYRSITDLDLCFDALGFPVHAEKFSRLLQQYPQMRTVLDHCLKPQIRDHSDSNFKEWASTMSDLAKQTSAYCKLSGVVTEANEDWSEETLRPYVEHVIEVFGPHRVIWGSDWPVVRLRCEYERWFEVSRTLTRHLSADEQAAVFGQNAMDFYRLELPPA